MRWLPNTLTIARLIVVPFVVATLVRHQFGLALALFFAAAITDGIDGSLARRFGWTSRTGAYLDPIADKSLLAAIFLALLVIGAVPGWLVALIFARDLAILMFSVWALAFTKIRNFSPSRWGKLSTFSQISCAVYIMATLAFPSWPVAWLRPVAIGLAAVGTASSWIAYGIRGWRMLQASAN